MMSTELEKYYNKFCEEKRLTRRHGYVEYVTSMKYIHEYLPQGKKETVKILDVGAGTGRYSVQLAGEGYDVTAVELVKYNLGILKSKKSSVKAYQGNALNLSRFEADQFDMVLVFGPMYHLDLYDYVRIEDIDAIDQAAGVKREKLIAADGPANYMRTVLNAMDEETYQLFIQYHLSTCERKDLLGASAHTLDIVRK